MKLPSDNYLHLLETDEIAILLEGAKAILKYRNFTTAARKIFDCCKKLTGARCGYVALLDKTGLENEVVFLESGGLPCVVDPDLPMPIRGLRAEVYATGEVHYENNFWQSEWVSSMPEGHLVLRNVLFSPLIIDKKIVGLLGLANKDNDFNEKDAQVAATFGEYAAIALHNSQNIEILRRRGDDLEKRIEDRTHELIALNQQVIIEKDQWLKTFDAISDIITIQDRDCKIVRANMAAYEAIEERSTNILGKYCYDVFSCDEHSREKCKTIRNSGQNRSFPFEVEHKSLDRIFSVNVFPVVDAAGKINHLVHVAKDVTEKKAVEAKLAEMQERFELAFHTSTDAININTLDGTYVEINEGFTALTGYTRDDVLGKMSTELDIWCRQEDRVKLLQGLREKGGVKNLESEFRLKDGSTKTALMSATIIKLKGVPHILSVTRDISDLKRATIKEFELERALHQARKMESLGRLTSGVAHDFNNILGIITGYSEMALETMDPEDEVYTYFETIYDATQRSTDIVRQLLAFSRQQAISPKVVNLDSSVTSMMKMLYRLVGEDIELVWQPSGESINTQVKIDPVQIDQILANLCVNARDAIGGVGRIAIRTMPIEIERSQCHLQPEFRPGSFVQLIVSDNGCGIPQEHLDLIFDPFFTSKEMGKGTGLGLATVYGIVKQNKGFITVNTGLGEGTTFTIYLPRHDEQPDSISGETENMETGHGEKILVVEDDSVLLDMTVNMLRRLEYTPLIAQTPAEAFALVENEAGEIEILLTDVVLPEMSGKQLAEVLTEEIPGVRVIYMSGYTLDEIAERGVVTTEKHFLHKPFTKTSLARAIGQLLKN